MQPEQKGTAEREAQAAFVRALTERARAEDHDNPWPRGCRYWHMHNEIWRRERARQERTHA